MRRATVLLAAGLLGAGAHAAQVEIKAAITQYSYWSFLKSFALIEKAIQRKNYGISPVYAVSYAGEDCAGPEHDAKWQVAVAGKFGEETIATVSGKYFRLPVIKQALTSDARIMFNCRSMPKSISVAWQISPELYGQLDAATVDTLLEQGQQAQRLAERATPAYQAGPAYTGLLACMPSGCAYVPRSALAETDSPIRFEETPLIITLSAGG